jgi:hypothetical protein
MVLTSLRSPNSKSSIVNWRISSFSDFIQYLVKHCGDDFTIFRGQREDKTLLPRVARLDPVRDDYDDILDVENKMIQDFEREAVTFVQRMPDNDWDLLALAQHHGLSTRLLDWTSNPLAGLWFAVHKPPKNKKKDAVVWVLRPDSDDIVRDASSTSSPFKSKRTKVFIPRHVTSRIRAQDGIFTVHKFMEDDRVIPLNSQRKYKSKLHKILIQPRYFPRIRYELNRCGVNAGSLFPDLDGLAKKIEWKYGFAEDE